MGRALAWNPPARDCGRGSVLECPVALDEPQGSVPRTAKRRRGEGVKEREKQPEFASLCPRA